MSTDRVELTPKERQEIRNALLAEDASNALAFQARAIREYGPAGGILLRELLFWDGKGWDPDGFTFDTKANIELRTGLGPKAQDGARARLERAGVLEVSRRPRRNNRGGIIHPSPVLHYRLRLRELLEQLAPEHQTLDHGSKHADADARTRGSGCSSARNGTSEGADTAAPRTEGPSEVPTEVPSEGSAPARDRGTAGTSHFDAKEPASPPRGQKTVSKLSEDEAERRWDALCKEDPRGKELRKLAELLAAENSTGKVAITRVWNELGEGFVKAREHHGDILEEAWVSGFDKAIARQVPNITWVMKAARGYAPRRRASVVGAGKGVGDGADRPCDGDYTDGFEFLFDSK